LTAAEIRNEVLSNYTQGQEVIIKILNEKGLVIDTYKATIEKFYPAHVSLKHNGYTESFTYWEFMRYASKFNQKKKIGVIPEKVQRTKYA
jgi:hypothetical protein